MNKPKLEPLSPARQYEIMLDSVNVVNSECAVVVKSLYNYEAILRNVVHLEYMLTKDFWTDEDMTPVHSAISLGRLNLDTRVAPPQEPEV